LRSPIRLINCLSFAGPRQPIFFVFRCLLFITPRRAGQSMDDLFLSAVQSASCPLLVFVSFAGDCPGLHRYFACLNFSGRGYLHDTLLFYCFVGASDARRETWDLNGTVPFPRVEASCPLPPPFCPRTPSFTSHPPRPLEFLRSPGKFLTPFHRFLTCRPPPLFPSLFPPPPIVVVMWTFV